MLICPPSHSAYQTSNLAVTLSKTFTTSAAGFALFNQIPFLRQLLATSLIAMATAAQRVFGIPELLEAILLEVILPELELTDTDGIDQDIFRTRAILRTQAKTIIASQCVSKAFCETIRGSSKLQQALCFRREDSNGSVKRPGDKVPQSLSIWADPSLIKIGPAKLEWTWPRSRFVVSKSRSFIKAPSLGCRLIIDTTSSHFQFGSWRQLLVAPPDASIKGLWLIWEEEKVDFVFNIYSIDTKRLDHPTLRDLVQFAEGQVQEKKRRDLETKLGDGGKNIYHGLSDLNFADDW